MTAKRILLIDDDPHFGNFFTKFAASKQVQVDHFENLLEASFEARMDSYDAIVVDCCIPDCDGYEIVQYIQTFFRGAKVIMISGSESAFARQAHRAIGAQAFVPKSLGVGAILNTAVASQGGIEYASRILF